MNTIQNVILCKQTSNIRTVTALHMHLLTIPSIANTVYSEITHNEQKL